MKQWILGLSLAMASVTANAQATSWAAINKNLDVVAQDVRKDFPFLTDLGVKFDARVSDLNGDRLKGSLTASTDQAKWGDQKVTMTVGAGVDARELKDTKRTVKGEISAQMKTQVIAGIKYAFASLFNECRSMTATPESYSQIRDQKVCQMLSQVESAQGISDVQAAVTGAYADYVNFVPTYVAQQKELLKVETDEDKKSEIEYNISAAESDLKQLASIKISGDANKIVVDWDLNFSFGTDIAVGLQLVMTEQNAKLGLEARGALEDADYQEFKKIAVETLTRIEQNEADMMRTVTDLAKAYAQFIGDYITK